MTTLEYNLLRKELDEMKAESENKYHPFFTETGGFHLHCILSFAGMYDCDYNFLPFCNYQLKAAIASITLVLIQYMSLFTLELEALLTTFSYTKDCNILNECAGGYFCEIPEDQCMSCEYSKPICYDEFKNVTDEFKNVTSYEDEAWEIYTAFVGIRYSSGQYTCISNLYCDFQDSDNVVGNDAPCPYWENSGIEHSFNAGTVIVLIFVGVVLAYSIYNDINQVTIEEVFFNNFIDKSEKRHFFAASLLRVSLYMRRIYLPWVSLYDLSLVL